MFAPFDARRWGILLLLMITGGVVGLYTYGLFARTMVLGFDWSGSQYRVVWVSDGLPLLIDDELIQLGSVNFAEFASDLRLSILDQVQPGQELSLVVKRGDQTLSLDYVSPKKNTEELYARLLSQWWLSWLFLSVALTTYYSLRPKDTRWHLLIAFFCLTAIWLSASTVSRLHLWESAIVLHMAIWLCVPVYWHLHWVFPERWPELRAWQLGRWIGYVGAILLVLLEWLQLVPQWLYLVGFVLATVGIIVPLLLRLRNKLQARQTRTLWAVLLIALTPLLVSSIWVSSGTATFNALIALLGLPALPLGYFYTAYRSQLGGFEIRANRFVAIGLFGLGLSVAVTLGVSILLSQYARLGVELEGWIIVLGVVFACLATAIGFPAFQRLVESRVLGLPTTPRHLLGKFLARITTSLDRPTLTHVLQAEILPSLQVTQSALLLMAEDAKPSWLYAHKVNALPELDAETVKQLLAQVGRYHAPTVQPLHPNYTWARVALRFTVEEKDVGLWLLGRRDPDDIYTQAEISYLQVIADQIALTLKVLMQTEQLRQLYQLDIDQREAEQSRLARDLHDLVLNNLAKLRFNSGPNPSPEFLQAYNVAVDSLRQTISNLRPPLLDYGLYEALKALASEHEYGPEDSPTLAFEIAPSADRYSAKVEEQIYRILQQAYENALKHAQAKHLRLAGHLTPNFIELSFEDDGVGLKHPATLSITEKNRHFGLLVMQERATLIGAELTFYPPPSGGTQVRLVWRRPNA